MEENTRDFEQEAYEEYMKIAISSKSRYSEFWSFSQIYADNVKVISLFFYVLSKVA